MGYVWQAEASNLTRAFRGEWVRRAQSHRSKVEASASSQDEGDWAVVRAWEATTATLALVAEEPVDMAAICRMVTRALRTQHDFGMLVGALAVECSQLDVRDGQRD